MTAPAPVKTARERTGHTQVSLAVAAGVSPATVHRIEAGRHKPTNHTMVAIARALGLDVSDLSWPEETTRGATAGSIRNDAAPTDAGRREAVGADHKGA